MSRAALQRKKEHTAHEEKHVEEVWENMTGFGHVKKKKLMAGYFHVLSLCLA